MTHSQIEHYFFSYLLTCKVYLIKVLEISAQMLQYVTFSSLKTIKMGSDFILNYLKKVVGGATTQIYQNQTLKPWYFLYGSTPRGPRGRIHIDLNKNSVWTGCVRQSARMHEQNQSCYPFFIPVSGAFQVSMHSKVGLANNGPSKIEVVWFLWKWTQTLP